MGIFTPPGASNSCSRDGVILVVGSRARETTVTGGAAQHTTIVAWEAGPIEASGQEQPAVSRASLRERYR